MEEDMIAEDERDALRTGEYRQSIKKRPAVDPRVFDLAGLFLENASEDDQWELAEVIQRAIEGWTESRS